MTKNPIAERATALYKSGNLREAEELCRSAVADDPLNAAAHCNLGIMLQAKGTLKEAFTHLQKAHELEPNNAIFCLNLANLLRSISQYEKAALLLERAVSVKPDYAAAWLNLGTLHKDIGNAEKMVEYYGKALSLKSDFQEAASNYAYSLMFLPSSTPQQIYEAHIEAANKCRVRSTQYAALSKSPIPSPQSLSRIGFVSGDFREHPAAYFTIGTIEWLNRNGYEVFLYANQLEEDNLTKRFKTAGTYRSIYNISDNDAAKMIVSDGVEILFDLTGHNARGRLGVFAQKPAPIQIAWAGYMATTGLPEIDYIIGDKWHMKEGDEKYYSEKIIRLPSSFICFDAPSQQPIIQSSQHSITFGCFNIPVKINAEVVKVWAEILRLVPDSILVLKAKQYSESQAKERIQALFEDKLISYKDRIHFIEGTTRSRHLDAFSEIDISLDPFPFSGSTTTLESLWMGVPVVTLTGSTMASRHSSSYLACLGLDELIAANADEYIEKAVSLALNPVKITEYKSSLRDRMIASPLYDIEKFAPEFLRALKASLPT